MKGIKMLLAAILLICFAQTAFACGGGGLTGGALESTQWLNKALLGDILGEDTATAVNTANQYAKQLQQYATQLQQFAEAVKSNFSLPFQVYNDLKNSFTSLYGTVRGTGEGLFSYANADSWYNDMKGRTGWLAQYQYNEKSNKAVKKVMDDIITKEESEAYLLKEAENMSKTAQGATSAVQANTMATTATAVAVKNQTAQEKAFYDWYINKEAEKDVYEDLDKERMRKENEAAKRKVF